MNGNTYDCDENVTIAVFAAVGVVCPLPSVHTVEPFPYFPIHLIPLVHATAFHSHHNASLLILQIRLFLWVYVYENDGYRGSEDENA